MGSRTYLHIRPFCPSDEVFQLVLHQRDDIGLDSDEELLLRGVVLQNDRERVLDFAIYTTQDSQEARNGSRAAEEQEGLVEGVAP